MGNKRGCPTCAGIDPKSCLRCAGKTKLSDWQATDNTAVIQALEKRIAELEAALSQSMGDHVDTGRALRLARAENQRLRAVIDDMATDPMGEYHTGLRCGVEDRDIACRYEAAEYGWEQAFEYIGSIATGALLGGGENV